MAATAKPSAAKRKTPAKRTPAKRAIASKNVTARRSFDGGRFDRLNADWITSQTSLDADLRFQLKTLINRARWFEQNTEYGEAYLKLIERNVVGPDPFRLQMKILNPDGAHDRQAEIAIETAWEAWGKKRNCSVNESMSLCDHYKVAARSIVRDGGCLIRKWTGSGFGPHQFQIEALDIDYLDPDYNVELKDGSRIVMSVEIDRRGRPVAYHLLGAHPGDIYWTGKGPKRTRVNADKIIHPFIRKRANQARGYTEFAAIMPNIKHLQGYKESSLVNARQAAARMMFLQRQPGELSGYSGEETEQGGKYMDLEPGIAEVLPTGMQPVAWDPKQPNTGYGDFVKENIRGNASALGISYMNLANDPGDANFSSARISVVEEREQYKMLQRVMIEHVCEDIFSAWLFSALGAGAILGPAGNPMPVGQYQKFNRPHFRGRRWPWLDPRADSEAAKNDLENGIVSVAQVIGERGGDDEQVIDEIAQTQEARSLLGLVPSEKLDAIAKARAMAQAEESDKPEPLIATLGVGGVQALTTLIGSVSQGQIQPQQAQSLLITVFGFSEEQARAALG